MSLSDDQPDPIESIVGKPSGSASIRGARAASVHLSVPLVVSNQDGTVASATPVPEPIQITRRDTVELPVAGITIGQFAATLRRRLPIFLALFLLCIAAALGLLAHAAPSYAAHSMVQVAPLTIDGGSGLAKDVNTITESHIVTSTSVAGAAGRALHYPGTVTALLMNVSVSSPLDSQVLVISYKSATAQGAADGADAFARAYLAYRHDIAQKQLDADVAATAAQLASVNKQLKTLTNVKNPNPQLTVLQAQATQLGNQLNGYRTTVVNPGQVSGIAQAPTGPSSPKKVLYLAGGVLFGLILGTAAAVLRDRRDDKIRGPRALEAFLGAPTLARTPGSRASKTAAAPWDVDPADATAYRTITTKLSTQVTGRGARSFLVVRGGAVSDRCTPAHLATTFARQGMTTALVATDEALQRTGELAADRSASSTAAGVLIAVDSVPGLHVLALGPELSLGTTLHASSKTMAEALGEVDVVVVDAVNLDVPSSALSLGRLSSAAIVVVADGRTGYGELDHNLRELAQVGSRPLGGILIARRRVLPNPRWRLAGRTS